MASPTAEARELSLVEKVELRIALTDTDSKLQACLNTYLAPLLLKLASEHVAVRNKVIAVCQHINKRIAPENIQLPVAALLHQFKDQPSSQLIRHFDLSYAQQGLPRLDAPDRAALLPVLASGIASLSSASASHAAGVFNLFLRCLVERPLPPRGSPEDERLRSDLGLDVADAAFLSTWIGKLIVLRLSSSQQNPFLSSDEVDFLTLQRKADVWDPSASTGLNLTAAKIAGLKLISSGAFHDEERLLPALYASADSNSRLSDTGEGLVKQAIARVSVEDTSLVTSLFQVYERSSSLLSLRIKILTLLAKSKASTSYSTNIIRLVNQGLVEQTDRVDREITKLRTAIIQYLGFAARNASSDSISAIAASVVDHLKEFLDQQYADSHSVEMRGLRGSCFEVIGLLASTEDSILLEPELSKLRWLFRCLAEESDKEVVFSIDSAISSTLKPFARTRDSEIKEALKGLLVDVLTLDSANPRNTRFACLRFANRCLPFNDVTARWIDIATLGAASSDSHDLIDEARKGLDPYWHELLSQGNDSKDLNDTANSGITAPDFINMTLFVFKTQKSELDSANKIHAAVAFCRRCLYWSCLYGSTSISTDVDWERKQDLAVSSEQDCRLSIRKAFAASSNDTLAQDAILLLFDGAMTGLKTDAASRPEFSSVLLELAAFSPDATVEQIAPAAGLLVPAITCNDTETRTFSAQTFGVLASHPAAQGTALTTVVSNLIAAVSGHKSAIGAQVNKAHGSLLALGYLSSREKLRRRDPTVPVSHVLSLIYDVIDDSADQTLQSAAYRSLSQLVIFQAVKLDALVKQKPINVLIETTLKAAKAGNEKAAATLGHYSMMLDDETDRTILDKLLSSICELHELRQAESQFVVGEALTCLAFDWDSTALLANIDVDASTVPVRDRSKQSALTIERVLQDSRLTKPSLKKAAVIWLLCILQFGSARPEVQQRLPQFQASFKRCLSDRDELVQESASRGLGLVYEKGDRTLKDSLVRDLVASFTSNKSETSGTVTEDTQLFEPGQLPTGDGSITTYKDIMSLASEVGDSSLVYRFMSLASHNAIWSSRAAFGRFGLSNVLSDSSVDGYLATNPKLYPKLYRYRFDPNTNVRRSMNDIWNALVKDPGKVLDSNFDAILEDLLNSIIGREWRARQASCAAVADLVQGRTLDKLQPFIDRIWSLCFKVLDDIKESVRAAAAELARVLTNILLRNLEGSDGKQQAIQQLLRSVLEFLLSTSGLESGAKEVQVFSLQTLLEMIKKGKPKNLRPFVPDLVVQLLGYLSTFEPEAVNYVALNAANYNLQQSDIDDMRLKSIRSSPLMEAIERCLDMLDDTTMAALAPKLQEALKTAVGVPSKVGYSRVLVTLSTRCNIVFRPHADAQLVAVQKRILDRNETVSSSYAAAMGYVARLATEERLIKTVGFARQLYFGEEATDRARYVAGEVMQAFARSATDRYNNIASETFPFVFFGRFDDDERVRNVFKETYSETVSGSRAVALYLDETLKLCEAHLDSNKWTFKHAAALAISEIVLSLAASYGALTEAQALSIWPGFRKALAEKSWDGKEKILDGFSMFVEKGDKFLQSRPQERAEIAKITLREAKRRNKAYQGAALTSLGRIASKLTEVDFPAVIDVASALIEEACDASQESTAKPADPVPDQCVVGAVEAVCGCLKARVQQQEAGPIESCAERILELARRAVGINVAAVQIGVLTPVKTICELLLQHHTISIAPALAPCLVKFLAIEPSIAQEKVRGLRADALGALATAISAAGVRPPPELGLAIRRMLDQERAPMIRNTLSQAQRRLDTAT